MVGSWKRIRTMTVRYIAALSWRCPPWLMRCLPLVIPEPIGTGLIPASLAKGLAGATGACYLRVDAVETALRRAGNDSGPEGYFIVHELAASNLLVGNAVVVDAVNPVPEARQGWQETAARAGARLVVLETSLSDEAEHRRRVETRAADIPGHRVPTWEEVQDDGWVQWDVLRDGPRTLVDTSNAEAALAEAKAAIQLS